MPAASTVPRPVVAAFDLDGTLTTRDCVVPFLWRVCGWRLPARLVRHPRRLGRALLARDVDAVKGLACAALAGLDVSDVEREGARFATDVHAGWLRDDTVARLRVHQTLGHRVVLVSASLEVYLTRLARLLDVGDVLCTRLEVGSDARLTGRLEGPNCRGPEKERRLRAWLAAEQLTDAELWAYGDSDGDAELLAMADRPQHVEGVIIPARLSAD